jgi:long-subunit fatty acid transport protein
VKHLLACACASTCAVTAATAGGLDQSGQPVTLLFRPGDYAEVALAYWSPTVEGSDPLGIGSGNVYGPIADVFAGVKKHLGDRLSMALIVDEPYGVNVDYPGGAFPYAGTAADPDSLAVTGLVRWRAGEHVALHGGLRAERIGAEVTLGGPAYGALDGYRWTGDDDWGVGWVAGASWEKPEIGLRVALTYGSEIRHELDSSETFFGASTTEVTMPQSVNLDVQTGLAAKTLVYGSVRWVAWDGWTVAPAGLDAVAGPLITFDSDAWTYRLGIGRQLTGALSAGFEVAHETAVDTMKSPLSPYDGFTAVSVGSSYALASGLTLSGSLGYHFLGDAEVSTPGNPQPARFEDNRAVAAQLRVGWSF